LDFALTLMAGNRIYGVWFGGLVMTGTWLEKSINLAHKHELHMRPAQRIVAVARKFTCDVRACKNDVDFDAKSILDMIEFAAYMVGKTSDGDNNFIFRASGDDAPQALDALTALIDAGFGLD